MRQGMGLTFQHYVFIQIPPLASACHNLIHSFHRDFCLNSVCHFHFDIHLISTLYFAFISAHLIPHLLSNNPHCDLRFIFLFCFHLSVYHLPLSSQCISRLAFISVFSCLTSCLNFVSCLSFAEKYITCRISSFHPDIFRALLLSQHAT